MTTHTSARLGSTGRTPSTVRASEPSTRWLAVLLIVEALLSFAPLAILAPAIGWPASLGAPPADQLTAIASKPEAVTAGYAVYLLYSVLIAPVMIVLAHRVFGGLDRPAAATVAVFAALSALARSIGILRWLTVMPALAAAHAGADAGARADIERLFQALTTYGGGIGEVLGVSLFMAGAVGTLSVAALIQGGLPRSLAALGLLVTALLGGLSLPALGVAFAPPVAIAVTALSVWMLAVAVWAWRR